MLVLLLWIILGVAPKVSLAGSTHWSLQPISSPPPPSIGSSDRSANPIDSFLLNRLKAKELNYAPPASPITLLRRATYDLKGLPPTPAEIESFLNDTAPGAFDRAVDRLLSSPHYGERWGRHWLDVARYADNKGYVFFEEKKFPWAYTYRDYVVEAFNKDLPYNRFILEQLAADQLDLGTDKKPLTAMGFLTLGGRFMNSLHDVLDDRIDVTTRGFLGLSVSCARCHDHKFDPIPQEDYYSLYGIFRSSVEPTLPPTFKPPENQSAFETFNKEMKVRTDKLNAFYDELHSNVAASSLNRMQEYLLAAHALKGVPPPDDFMLITPKGALNPSVIHRWRAYLEDAGGDSVWIPWHELGDLPTNQFNPGPLITQWQSKGNSPPNINGVVLEALSTASLKSMEDVAKVYAGLIRSASTMNSSPETEALKQLFSNRKGPVQVPRQLGWGFLAFIPDRETQGVYKKIVKEVEDWSMNAPNAPPRAMVLVDAPELYDPKVFLRGNPNQLGPPVQRQFLSALSQAREPFEHGSGRLELANSIASDDNPLTARVMVNRIWHHHFGQGLVNTTSDFGTRGDRPSHPQLLDYLANTFINQGWSIKQMHRLIMSSQAYQQRSTFRQSAHAVDPENRLLWKFNRMRLDFETTRDALLAVSGRLDSKVGGPAGDLFSKNHKQRRTLYGFIDRMDLPGLRRAFDFPDPNITCPRRDETTVPPQALFFMNHPFVADCARSLVDRPEVKASNDRLLAIYQLLYGRSPTASEQEIARRFFAEQPSDGDEAWRDYAQALLMANEFVYID